MPTTAVAVHAASSSTLLLLLLLLLLLAWEAIACLFAALMVEDDPTTARDRLFFFPFLGVAAPGTVACGPCLLLASAENRSWRSTRRRRSSLVSSILAMDASALPPPPQEDDLNFGLGMLPLPRDTTPTGTFALIPPQGLFG